MKIAAKISLFIILLLLSPVFYSNSMKRNITNELSQETKIVSTLLLNDTQQIASLNDFHLCTLPEEIKKEIIYFLIAITTAESYQIAATALRSLSQVNKELNELINNPVFCLELIKHFAVKFNCSDQEVAETLPIKQAHTQLALQNQLITLCYEKNPNHKKFNHLLQKGADIDFIHYGESNQIITPLMIAVINGSATASFLLEKGADSTIIDEDGNTLIMLALIYGHDSLAQKLINYGKPLMINQQNKQGETALSIATYAHHGPYNKNLITDLLKAGANPEMVSNYNGITLTPIAYMQKMNKNLIDMQSDDFFTSFNPTEKSREDADEKRNTLKEIIKEMLNAIPKKHENKKDS